MRLDSALPIIQQLSEEGRVVRPWLGKKERQKKLDFLKKKKALI